MGFSSLKQLVTLYFGASKKIKKSKQKVMLCWINHIYNSEILNVLDVRLCDLATFYLVFKTSLKHLQNNLIKGSYPEKQNLLIFVHCPKGGGGGV